jgi:hypothetical protein
MVLVLIIFDLHNTSFTNVHALSVRQMYLSKGGYGSSRSVYMSHGGYSSGSAYLPHSGVVHSVGPVYMDPVHIEAAEQYRQIVTSSF